MQESAQAKTMTAEDLAYLKRIVDKTDWLFYGDLDEHIDGFVRKICEQANLSDFGFGRTPMTPDFAVAYWFLVSTFVGLDLLEYGTSPRGCWWTEEGKRFQRIIIDNINPIQQAVDSIYADNQ